MTNGLHTRLALRDHGWKHRNLFLRQPLWERVRRWCRKHYFGMFP